ncbi:translocation/assembly module TamB domain-containing protein [Sphingomonas paeninsulae]|uniref:translocation/assembly module TamB domain-containing protein n=1 Tax=Sphingomonas paeninsulae TaxID=2319844 RepID=UPI001EF115E0|nr:translocation/assembly module TamB domain-containing protein [Sphingomonas paeninsulae]
MGFTLFGLLVLAGLAVLGLNTAPGRKFVANQIAGYTLASGLGFEVGQLDGSLYGNLIIRNLRVHDAKGVFATAPEIRLDWRPFAFISNHVDVRSAIAPLIEVSRLPQLKPVPSDPNAPTLPDLDIDIGRLKIDRLVLAAPVTGAQRIVAIDARAKIADRRAQITGTAASTAGDHLALKLDAVPDDNRLIIDARLQAPSGGVVTQLAGLKAPLVATVTGRGSWANWQGNANALLGGQSLTDLAITAHSGAFTVKGPTRPGLILTGPVERLTAPNLYVDASATVANRRADTRITLKSNALVVVSSGAIDLAKSRFDNLKVDARLLTPGAIAPNLNGRDVGIALLLDGAFARPLIDYRLDAAAIGFGTTIVEGLHAEGRATVDTDHILIPLNARARRVTGLNPAAGGLLTNLTINGQLAVTGKSILSDNLKIHSDKVDATALVVTDLTKGIYRGALKGRVNDYLIDGIGRINLNTDVKLVTVPSGGFGMTGHVVAQTVRIFNKSASDFLGGPAIVGADVGFDPQGTIAVRNLRLNAPSFRILSGEGTYRSDGRIAFNSAATSKQYGPLVLAITGTATQPLIHLKAARPNVGVQLTNVDAVVRGTGTGYSVKATGGSPYGPFNADVLIHSGKGPLAIDINRARFANIDFAGRIVQTAPGPFAGRLTANGAGVAGIVTLAAQGKVQRADIDATANNARIPGASPITIDRAIIKAVAILYPNAPSIVGDAQVAGLRQGAFVIQTARAKIDYRGGRGSAQLVATGSNGAPFQAAINTRLSPDLYTVAAQGRINAITFRLAQPATIRANRGIYTLEPATITLQQGQIVVSGRYGNGMDAHARFQNLDLSLLNSFAAGAGVGGKATGSLDYAQASAGALPIADLRLDVAGFTRSGATAVSAPVNIAAIGQLRAQDAVLNALVRRNGAMIGRVQARLQPLGSDTSLSARLMNAGLGGGIRYNGPADVLWSLSGIADQQLSGQIGIAADFAGRISAPQLTGVVRANDLTYNNETYGTRIRAIKLSGRFTNDRFEISDFSGKAGEGTVQAKGNVGFAADSGFPINVSATFTNAQLARSDALGATVSGTLAVTNDKANGALIRGDLRLPEARYEVIRQGAAEISELSGVRRRGAVPVKPADATSSVPGLFKLDLRVHADHSVFVSGMGLEAEWATDLRVGGTSSAPVVTGDVKLVRGTYSFAGRRFDLDTSSKITFLGSPVINPELAIAASTTVNGVTATINITGTAQRPQIVFGSTPTLPQDEILSRLLFGTSVTSLSATQALQLAAALNSLRGSGGGLNPLGKLRSATGIDRLRVLGADASTGRGTAVAAGKYISNNIYIEIVTDAKGFTATQLQISLSKALSILSQAGGSGGTNATIRYSKDF